MKAFFPKLYILKAFRPKLYINSTIPSHDLKHLCLTSLPPTSLSMPLVIPRGPYTLKVYDCASGSTAASAWASDASEAPSPGKGDIRIVSRFRAKLAKQQADTAGRKTRSEILFAFGCKFLCFACWRVCCYVCAGAFSMHAPLSCKQLRMRSPPLSLQRTNAHILISNHSLLGLDVTMCKRDQLQDRLHPLCQVYGYCPLRYLRCCLPAADPMLPAFACAVYIVDEVLGSQQILRLLTSKAHVNSSSRGNPGQCTMPPRTLLIAPIVCTARPPDSPCHTSLARTHLRHHTTRVHTCACRSQIIVCNSELFRHPAPVLEAGATAPGFSLPLTLAAMGARALAVMVPSGRRLFGSLSLSLCFVVSATVPRVSFSRCCEENVPWCFEYVSA